jgi:hypothetical protein
VLWATAALPRESRGQSDASSIREFVAAKDKWPRLVGQPLRLEGRYTVYGSRDMRFAGCDVPFLLPRTFLRPRRDSRNVEVSGRLMKRDGEYVFLVSDLKSRTSDGETLALRRSLIDAHRPEALYKLAEWARLRGDFYDDDELKQAAYDLFADGLDRARERLEADDIEGLRDLARRAGDFGLPDRIRYRYLHEAHRAAFEVARTQEHPQYEPLIERIAAELPGSTDPLTPDKMPLRENYLKEPRAVYFVADDDMRKLFHRVLYSEVAVANIELAAAADGSNGYEVASRIARQLPEISNLADAWRDRELQFLTGRIPQLSRQQVLDLADRYAARGQPESASRAKRDWLKSRERQAERDGPGALMDLGDEYLNLLQDEIEAARMFQRAYGQNPQLASAAGWLSEHGYELKEGRWSRPGEGETQQKGRVDEAIHQGTVLAGMTGPQVRAALQGAPSSVVRIVSAGTISEIWLYEGVDISVQLSRASHEKELQVRRVTFAP